MCIRLLQRHTDPQVNFQPRIVHHCSVGELTEHDRIGGVRLFAAVDVFPEGIHPVFYFRKRPAVALNSRCRPCSSSICLL